MKIELGNSYVTKMGTIVGIIEALPNPICGWVYRGDNNIYYSPEGKVSLKGDYDDSCDLVREYLGKEVEECDLQLQQSKYVQEAEDMVNSPPHYTQGPVECIDAIQSALSPEEFKGYLRGNILKYMWRTNQKGGKQDLEKSLWYLNKLIEVAE